MKAIIMSVSTLEAANILKGEQILILRKSAPSLYGKVLVYLYSKKDGWYRTLDNHRKLKRWFYRMTNDATYRGKVIAKFTLDYIDEITKCRVWRDWECYAEHEQSFAKVCAFCCLTHEEILAYLGKSNHGYTWHVSDLVVFRKPKPLSEFGLKNAPRGWQYVEVEE